MIKNKRLILWFAMLLLQPVFMSTTAQYTTTSHGIIVNVGGQQVELAVAKTIGFRLSISFSKTPSAINSIFIDDTDTSYSDFTVVSNAPSYRIKTSYGSLTINSETKKWSLSDSSGMILIPEGSFRVSETSQIICYKPKSKGICYGSGNLTSESLVKVSSSPSMDIGATDLPYLWNSSGYSALGISSNDDSPARWTSSKSSSVTWTFFGPSADLYLWPAKNLYDAMKGLVQLTGKPKVPPKWAFGYLQSRWGWEDRKYIENTIDSFRILKLPVDAFIYDFEWYTVTPDYNIGPEGTHDFSDFRFNSKLFPDSSLQIASYKSRGVKFIAIRKPRLCNSANLNMARQMGWLENTGIGNRDLNFRIDNLRQWYFKQTKPILDAGIDAWWNDEGESYYTCYYWWNKTQSDLRDSIMPNDRHFTLNRAFSPGNQRFGYCTWTGDRESTWEVLHSTPATLLNWSLSGMFYSTCDIGGLGFHGQPSAENLVRWFQAGVFFPVMRAHSLNTDIPHFPWLWGEDGEAAIRKALNLRYQLIPLIYSLGHEAFNTGAPIMRPLIMEFPDDSVVVNMTDEWLLGKGLLVAPIMNQGGTRDIYLPKDLWYDFLTNEIIKGPQNILVTRALDQIPIYVRAGTILPIGPVIQFAEEDTIAPIEIRIYPGHDASFMMTEDDGKSYNYMKDIIRVTNYSWTDSTNTLSWQVKDSYKGRKVFTTIKCILGNEEKTAFLGTQGRIVFSTNRTNRP